MTVTDTVKPKTPNVEFPVIGGGFSPPDPPEDDGGGPGPDNERGRLMLLIYNARRALRSRYYRRSRRARRTRAASLRYLQVRTGFERTRLWRAVEDLEDLGYVEIFRDEPESPLSRWLARHVSPDDRVFASTFLVLTEAGRYSPELGEFLAEAGKPERGLRFAGTGAAMKVMKVMKGLRRLPSNLTGGLAAEWRAAGSGDPERRALARLNLIAWGLGALCLAGLPAVVLALVALA